MLNVIETSTKQTYIIRPLLSALPSLRRGWGRLLGGFWGRLSYCKLNPTAYALIFVTIDSKPLLRVGERC